MISLKRKDSQNEIDKVKQTYRWEPKTNSRVRNRQVWSSYFGSEPTVNDINLQMQFSSKGSRDQENRHFWKGVYIGTGTGQT